MAELQESNSELQRKLALSIESHANEIQQYQLKFVALRHLRTIYIQDIQELKSLIPPKQEEIHLHKMLVVLICVGEYDRKTGLLPLKGPKTDHKRMQEVFGSKYKYTIVTNKHPKVTEANMNTILSMAKAEFTENEYDGIIAIFSGHGNRDYLLLSESRKIEENNMIRYEPHKYSRVEFESYFNGNNFKDQEDKACAYKVYFVDACRGEEVSQAWQRSYDDSKENMGNFGLKKGNKNNTKQYIHPEMNKCVMHANSNNYCAYEVPFDGKDID